MIYDLLLVDMIYRQISKYCCSHRFQNGAFGHGNVHQLQLEGWKTTRETKQSSIILSTVKLIILF